VSRVLSLLLIVVVAGRAVAAQDEPATRTALIEQAEAERSATLRPFVPNRVEQIVTRATDSLLGGHVKWHPFWTSAYSGGGFTLGAGYNKFLGSYASLDTRGSITFSGYKRIETELLVPRLFARTSTLTVTGGWREATEVGFYGLGTEGTSKDDRTNYAFNQPYLSATLSVRPQRRAAVLRGAFELSQWNQGPATQGDFPSVEQVYPPGSLPGLGAQPVYWHSSGTVGVDTRSAVGYARRGGSYGVTAHDYHDRDHQYGFQQLDYEAIQHIPIGRDAWVISLRAQVETAFTKGGQEIPFYMLPSLGSGSNLRGYASWRFRDANSLLGQAEWRIIVNRFFDTALFVDAGKVTALRGDLNFSDLKTDYGVGFRFHGPATTPLRIDIAGGSEGLQLVFAAAQVF
jgi:hypothetical protein